MASPDSPVQLIDEALLDRTLSRALASERRRTNHNFHESAAANPHRFLNALVRGTYCPPHRHVTPPKSESFLALRGEVALFVFDATGRVLERHVLGRGGLLGVDVPEGVWHSIAVLTETAVCYEVKPGPWDAGSDKELAPWAPREGSDDAQPYLASLLASTE